MTFACEFSVPQFAVLARSKQVMPVTLKFRFFGLWSPKPFVVASSNVGTMFPCNKTEAAK